MNTIAPLNTNDPTCFCGHDTFCSPEVFAETHKIVMDTSSLMHAGAPAFWSSMAPLLECFGNRITVPACCVDELRHATYESETQATACRVLTSLKELSNDGFVAIRGTDGDLLAEDVILDVFHRFCGQYNLLLITQDPNLAREVGALNELAEAEGKHVSVCRLDSCGSLIPFEESFDEMDEPEAMPADDVDETPPVMDCNTASTELINQVINVIHSLGDAVKTYTIAVSVEKESLKSVFTVEIHKDKVAMAPTDATVNQVAEPMPEEASEAVPEAMPSETTCPFDAFFPDADSAHEGCSTDPDADDPFAAPDVTPDPEPPFSELIASEPTASENFSPGMSGADPSNEAKTDTGGWEELPDESVPEAASVSGVPAAAVPPFDPDSSDKPAASTPSVSL